MLIGPSDRYGVLDVEDVDDFQELEPEEYVNDKGFDPMAQFERNEFRNFERDFEEELGDDDEFYDDEAPLDEVWPDDEEMYDPNEFDDQFEYEEE